MSDNGARERGVRVRKRERGRERERGKKEPEKERRVKGRKKKRGDRGDGRYECSKRHSLQAVQPSHRFWQSTVQIALKPPALAMAARFTVLGKPRCGPAGRLALLLIKSGDVETNLVRQPHANKFGFAISTTDKYTIGSIYLEGTAALNIVCN